MFFYFKQIITRFGLTSFLMSFCSASLASLTREVGPQVVSGDPARKRSPPVSVVAPRLDNSDSSLKFTHVLYNLSPAGNFNHFCLWDSRINIFSSSFFFFSSWLYGCACLCFILHMVGDAELYEQAIKFEKGSYITASGALATLSGAKTGRSPKDKRVVREETSQDDLWWGK